MTPQYVVIHTSSSSAPEIDIRDIDKWHRANGWSGCGYHYVILDDNRYDRWRDGEVQEGRPLGSIGAHTRGINHESIGICLIGDGDNVRFTNCQWLSLSRLCISLLRRYSLPVEAVIGHHEVNDLIARGLVAATYATEKTCPGTANSMVQVRGCLRSLMNY